MQSRLTVLQTLLISLLTSLTAGGQQGSPELSPQKLPANGRTAWRSPDSGFYVKVLQISHVESELSNLAIAKTSNSDVYHLATAVLREESKVVQQLTAMAKVAGVDTSSLAGSREHPERDQLAGSSRSTFDQSYIDLVSRFHSDEVRLFQEEADAKPEINNPDLVAFAQEHLPVLQGLTAVISKSGDSLADRGRKSSSHWAIKAGDSDKRPGDLNR